MMKKSLILLSALTACLFPMNVSAAEESVNVHVLICQDEVKLDKDINVKDADGDGALTFEDALITAHDLYYPGGAEAGYALSDAGYTFIWGLGGSYDFCNTAKGKSPDAADVYRWFLKDGDSLAWVRNSEESALCDYYYLEAECLDEGLWWDPLWGGPAMQGADLRVTVRHQILTSPTAVPVEGAELTVCGKKTGVKTGADGSAVLKMDMLGECRLGAVAEGTEVDSPYLFNVIPETEKVPARVIVRTSNSEPYAPFDYAFSVIDYDGDGTVTTDDALHQIHDWYYAGCASDCKAARGQNKIWGRTGAFVCEVQNADGQIVFTGAAAAENAVPYVLEPECTVTFRPETVLDKMYQVRWYDGHAMTETASLAPGEHTGIQAICWLPDKTFEDLVVNAEVLIDGKATGIFTDEYGMADIPANLKGLHTITVRAEGADAFNTLSFTVGNGGEAAQMNTEPVNNAETAAESAEPETVRTEAQETIVHQAVTKLPSNASAAEQNESVQTVTAQASSAQESDPTPMIVMILSSGALCAFAGGMFMMFREMK